MNKMPYIPARFETERLYLRSYMPGDGTWYYAMSQKNRSHLIHYESENVVMTINSEEDAERTVQELAADWAARNCFFMGAFDRRTDEFVANIYVGTVNRNLPEFEIGYFVDVDHEGQGFVTEAVKAVLRFVFTYLEAHRVRIQCSDNNSRSLRVAERCGFIKEGHFRENTKRPDGTIEGTIYYGLLKSEYHDRPEP